MIRGISVELLTDSGEETVENVLVGEPAYIELHNCRIPTYTIAIPKGDRHEWLDRKLRFFGMTFRTVGYPEQGIDENIPLYWNKKIKVELLDTNAGCTVYEKNTFAKHVFRDVFFYDGRGEKTTKTGDISAEAVTVYIYGCCHDGGYRPRAGDIIIEGECPFEFDVSSEKSTAESMSEFRKLYPDFAVIKAVSRKVYGVRPDYEITAG